MNQEERTAKFMDLGYLVDINMSFWMGSVMVYPEDLGVQKQMLPLGRQSLQVMSKPWVKKVSLLRDSTKKSLGYLYSHLVTFEGGRHRFVLKGAAKLVAESLDAQAVRASKFYSEVADNERETKRIARQVISKNGDHLWKTVSHLFPRHLGDKAPMDWKARVIESVMEKRFPAPGLIAASGISYSMYTAQDARPLIAGRYQKPFPGLLVDCGALGRDVHRMPEDLFNRLQKRIPPILKKQKSGGIHTLTIKNIERDLKLYEAFNPIEVGGHGMEEAWAQVQDYLANLRPQAFRERKEYREELAQQLLVICRILRGPWAEQRRDIYTEVFGGG